MAAEIPDWGDNMDREVFEQILDMDEDPVEHEFSKELVNGFFDQAKETFGKMDEALKTRELKKLSDLGHFLKGSSATLGLVKIRDSCQIIQQYGKKRTVEEEDELDEAVCFTKITDALKQVKKDMAVIKPLLLRFYREPVPADDDAKPAAAAAAPS